MSKIRSVIENIIFAISLQILLFLCGYYHCSGAVSVWSIIYEIFLFALLALLCVLHFSANRTPFGKILTKKSESVQPMRRTQIRFLLILLLEIFFEILMQFCRSMPSVWTYAASVMMCLIGPCVLYALAVRKEFAIWQNRACFTKMISMFALIGAIGLGYGAHLWKQYESLSLQYTENSAYLLRSLENLRFINGVTLFLIETLALLLLIGFHAVADPRQIRQEKGTGFSAFIRCDLLIAAAVCLCAVNMGIAPQNVLVMSEAQTSKQIHHEVGSGWNISSQTWVAQQGLGDLDADSAYYCRRTVQLQKGNAASTTFELNGAEPQYFMLEDGEHTELEVQLSVGDSQVYLYGYYAIGIFENGNYKLYKTEDLDMSTPNPILTSVLVELIEQGNLYAFAAGSEYLMNHAPSAIQPYLERYAAGNFNAKEQTWLDKAAWREEYILRIANQN